MFNSKSAKFVWTLNGYLLLLALLFALSQIGSEIITPWLNSSHHERGLVVGETAEIARELNVSLQHLEYDTPTRIANSPYYYSSVYVLDKNMPEEVKNVISTAGDISRKLIGASINVLFFKEDRSEVRKLLAQNSYIHEVDAPTTRPASQQSPDGRNAFPNHILYQIATKDSNEDNRINEDDAMAYYLSDFSGKNLKQITPDDLHLQNHWYASNYSEIYFEEIIEDPVKTIEGFDYRLQERRLYYYNLQTEEFGAFEELEEVFKEIEAEYQAGGDL